MSCAIRPHCQPGIEESEFAQSLKAMVATGFIAIEEKKILYAQSAV